MLPPSTAPQRGSSQVYAVASLTVVALGLTAPVIFFLAYAFNDFPDASDHLRFVSRTLGVAAVVAVLSGVCITLTDPRMRWQPFAGAAGVVFAVYAAAGAGYAFLSIFPALDPAVGSSASDLTCAVYAVALATAAVASGSLGRRWLDRP